LVNANIEFGTAFTTIEKNLPDIQAALAAINEAQRLAGTAASPFQKKLVIAARSPRLSSERFLRRSEQALEISELERGGVVKTLSEGLENLAFKEIQEMEFRGPDFLGGLIAKGLIAATTRVAPRVYVKHSQMALRLGGISEEVIDRSLQRQNARPLVNVTINGLVIKEELTAEEARKLIEDAVMEGIEEAMP